MINNISPYKRSRPNIPNFGDVGKNVGKNLDIDLDPEVVAKSELYDTKYYTKTYYKWLNDNYTHLGYKYTPNSINIDTQKFNLSHGNESRGLYFTDGKNFLRWKKRGIHLHRVKILPNTPVYSETPGKFKAPGFYLGEEIIVNTCEYWDLVCASSQEYINKELDKLLDFSGKNKFNILDKNLDIAKCIYSCICPTSQTKNKHIDTLKMIRDIYIPEIKNKYITQSRKLIQSPKKFEEYLTNNISRQIIKTLKDTRSMISGSSVLKFMLGDDYPVGDIDIYCNESGAYMLLTSLKLTVDEQLDIKYMDCTMDISKEQILNYNMSGIVKILGIRKNTLNVQLIIIKDSINTQDFIKTNFDFDFCKCGYNGSEFNIWGMPNIGNKIGKISDEYMKKCFKTPDHYSLFEIAKTVGRMVKYIKRGFDITNSDRFLDNVIKYSNNFL
jgi:hypothetical protein